MKQFFLLDSYQCEEMKSIRRISDFIKYKILSYKIFTS